jgi:hypothetical protein
MPRPHLDSASESALRHLLTLQLEPVEKARAQYLLGEPIRVSEDGAHALEILYDKEGIYAVMNAARGRGQGFAVNQSQGYWAEQLLRNYIGSVQFVGFGLSDPTNPGDAHYDAIRRKHRYILLTEGKRPDLLAFPQLFYVAHMAIDDWANRPLTPEDRHTLSSDAVAAVEIKSSLQNYTRYQDYRDNSNGARNLSITIKDEELLDMDEWQQTNPLPPILIAQVFVDAVYCASYANFREEMGSGRVRTKRDDKTGKVTHFMEITGSNSSKIADIILPGGQQFFPADQRGLVVRPTRWPTAILENVTLAAVLGKP